MNRLLLAALVGLTVFCPECTARAQQVGTDVWAVVNGRPIRKDQVEKEYRARLMPGSPEPSEEEALSRKLNILDELINSEILFERASKMNLVATDAEVENEFTKMKASYTEDEFQRKLKEIGYTVDDVKSNIRQHSSIQKLLNHEVIAKISITDMDVSDFYIHNQAQFNITEPQYHIAQIVVTSHPDPAVHNRKNDKATNEAEAVRKVAMLEQKLSNGTDFAQLAMDYSEDTSASIGGDLGFVPESALSRSDPALKKAVLAMKPGEVTQPIPSSGGYRILKLVAEEVAGQRQLSDPQVQQGIRDALRSRKEQQLREAYIGSARDGARVTNYKRNPDVARQSAESDTSAKTKKPMSSATVILIDTDDSCRLTVDDQDEGIITPAQSKKIDVGPGDHIVKCVVENVPDLMWRKVVEAKSSEQAAAIIALKALHIQYDQAVGQAQLQKEQVAAAEAKLKNDEAQFPEKLFEQVKGIWRRKTHSVCSDCSSVITSDSEEILELLSLNNRSITTYYISNYTNGSTTSHSVFLLSLQITPPDLLTEDGAIHCLQVQEYFKHERKGSQPRGCPADEQSNVRIRLLDSNHLQLAGWFKAEPMVFDRSF